jgi:hypothetical protein
MDCGGSTDDDPPGWFATLECSGAPAPQPDTVSFGCPGSAPITVGIAVILGGPTSSTDIYGVKFDVIFDDSILRFQAPAIEGSFLNRDGAATIIEAAVAPSDPGRVVVALTRQGAVSGLRGTSVEQTVVTLFFSGVHAGGTVVSFANAEVVDSSLAPIAGIQFVGSVTVSVR